MGFIGRAPAYETEADLKGQPSNEPRGGRTKRWPINGWLIVDKPQLLVSNHALARVKRLICPQKAGIAGILDPLATGCLPIAFGEATKTIAYAVDARKHYQVTVNWGCETDSHDALGVAVAHKEQRPLASEIIDVLPEFCGRIMQEPPIFSSVRVKGRRSYELARQGETPELAARPVDIDNICLLHNEAGHSSVFSVECGKGTYIRALARDLGRRLGCLGHIAALRRLRVGCFGEDEMISLAMLEQMGQDMPRSACGDARWLLPVHAVLENMPSLEVTFADAKKLADGGQLAVNKPAFCLYGDKISFDGRKEPSSECPQFENDLPYHNFVQIHYQRQMVAICEFSGGRLRPNRVFNLAEGLQNRSGHGLGK